MGGAQGGQSVEAFKKSLSLLLRLFLKPSFIHELLTILFSKSLYPNDLSFALISKMADGTKEHIPLEYSPPPDGVFAQSLWASINMPITAWKWEKK